VQWKGVHISTVTCSNFVASFPLGKRERAVRIFSSWKKDAGGLGRAACSKLGSTDEHLPVIDGDVVLEGVGVLEGLEESGDGRVLHVKGEAGAGILDSLGRVGLERLVRTVGGTRSRGRTFWNLEKNLDMAEDAEGWGGY
jgi:hypothetical protein